MRLRSPAEYYIKFLCVHPSNYATADIRERLLDEGLDFISDEYIERVRRKLTPPDPFYPTDRRHKASMDFILDERINSLFQRTVPMKMALELLDTPRAKEFVETMLLIQVPPSAISAFVSRHRDVVCTPDALELYKHYFWNINLLDSSQMRALIQLRMDLMEASVPEFRGRKDVLKSAYYRDPRKTAAELPYSPTTAMLAQLRLGIKPGKYELSLRMLEARDQAVLRMVEAGQQGSRDDSQNFLNWANGARILEELLQMVVKPEDGMREQLRSIALRTETREIPSIHQLSDGRHTVDVSPTKDPDHDDTGFEPVTSSSDEHPEAGG